MNEWPIDSPVDWPIICLDGENDAASELSSVGDRIRFLHVFFIFLNDST